MANPLSFPIDADGSKARQEMAKLARDVAKLKEATKDMSDASARQAADEKASRKDLTAGINESIGSVTRLAAQWLTVQGAINLTTAAARDYFDQQDRALQSQRSYGEALTGGIRNLPDWVTGSQYERDILNLSRETGVPKDEVARGMETLLSARGTADYQKVLDVERTVAKAVPFGEQARNALGGAALDMLKAAPKGTTPQQIEGELIAAAGYARTEDIGLFAKNVAGGAAGLMGYGGTDRESLALISAMTSVSADKSGATSSTALKTLAEKAAQFGIKGSPLDIVNQLQRDEKLRGEFLSKTSLPVETGVHIRALLDPNSQAAANLKQALAGIPDAAHGEAAYKNLLTKYSDAQSVALAQKAQRGEALLDAAYAARGPDAIAALARKTREDALTAMGATWFERKSGALDQYAFETLGWATGKPTDDAAVRAAQIAINDFMGQHRGEAAFQPGGEAYAEFQRQTKLLERLATAAEANNQPNGGRLPPVPANGGVEE